MKILIVNYLQNAYENKKVLNILDEIKESIDENDLIIFTRNSYRYSIDTPKWEIPSLIYDYVANNGSLKRTKFIDIAEDSDFNEVQSAVSSYIRMKDKEYTDIIFLGNEPSAIGRMAKGIEDTVCKDTDCNWILTMIFKKDVIEDDSNAEIDDLKTAISELESECESDF